MSASTRQARYVVQNLRTKKDAEIKRLRSALEEIAKCDCHAAETAQKALAL